MTDDSAEVVIVGAGPAGLMLAGELALAGIRVALLERRESQALAGSRAGGLQPRSLEVLDQRGIAGRFVAEGQISQVAGFAFNSARFSATELKFITHWARSGTELSHLYSYSAENTPLNPCRCISSSTPRMTIAPYIKIKR